MLDDAGAKAPRLALDRGAEMVDAAIADMAVARHLPGQSRHREAGFQALGHVLAQQLDLGIYQHGKGARFGLFAVFPMGARGGDVKHHQTQRYMHLWRRQAGARGIGQGVYHVLHQHADFGRPRVADSLRNLFEQWMPHAGNLENSHGPYNGLPPPSGKPGKA